MSSGEVGPNVEEAPGTGVPDPRREVIRNRLAQLVSTGTSQLYADACKHMDDQPPLATTTHTVANLLREVESSMRAVLRPLTPLQEEESCDECGKPTSDEHCACGRPVIATHSAQIDAILAALGIDASDPIGAAWKYVAQKQHKYTHRKNLELPRPVDEEFLQFWAQMEAVLTGVLDRFESNYSGVFDKLDELMQKDPPTTADAKAFCSSFANNQTTHGYFFGKLESPVWLPLLRREGVFKQPPVPVYFEGGGVQHPSWPPTAYLTRMASISPAEVLLVLREVEPTENDVVKSALLEVAAELPEADRLSIMGRLTEWI